MCKKNRCGKAAKRGKEMERGRGCSKGKTILKRMDGITMQFGREMRRWTTENGKEERGDKVGGGGEGAKKREGIEERAELL